MVASEGERMPSEVRFGCGAVTLAARHWTATQPTHSAPVLLLPATGETCDDWDPVANRLSRSRSVFAISLRGHGRSDWPGTYSIQLMADDVGALLRTELADQPVDLVGHSLGGLVACAVAAAHPTSVRRLVLEDVGLLKPRPSDPPDRPAGTLEFDWRVVEQVRPEIDAFDPHWSEVVASVMAPTLVVGGGATSFVPQQQVADLARRLPDGRLVTLDTGHSVHQAEPQLFAGHVLSFLDS